MASRIRDINKKLNKINKEANDFGLIRFHRASFPPSTTAKVTLNRETDSIASHYIVGRAKDETRLVEILLSLSGKAVSVIPILGMGGLGKTTLAQSIYKNSQVHSHFEKKIWVCVSDNFDVTRLLKMILESLTRRNVEMTSRDVIVQEIREQLVGKKFFLVLDDVWTENLTLWDDFFGKLSDDDCWSILTKKAIAGGEIPKQLHVMKKEIIKKCGGLPLAASVMGGLLRMKRKEEWQLVLKNKLSNFSGDEDGVMEILKLSFDCLPSPSIKKCFAYCSIFPRDTMMKGDMLIELWMSEGLLQANVNNQMMMEEIGMNCLRILLQSSLFEETKSYQEIDYYKMHDLVHDLAESMSKSTKVVKNIRYLAVDLSGGREEREKLLERLSTSLRTLFVKGDLSGDMLMKLKNLYVLNLSHATTQELPITIGKLTHLRYVNLSSSRIRILPDSLCKLYNLQTLALDSMYVKDLPKGMCNLISLRHLYFYTFDEKFQMPLEMGRLSCLQTLEFFNVGREKGRQIEELGCLKNLKGSLSVRNLQLVKDRKAAEEANLFGKANLFRLILVWALAWDREGDNYNYDKDVLDGLRPHPNLEELVIQRFMGDQFPRWSMDLPITLPKLARLEFYYCHRCGELLPLQNFTFLKELVIWFCPSGGLLRQAYLLSA
ncbi:unnamed protein product [Coffea canephora]|uniref:DH200=94 genomic scaffold, scaffold_4589 n=1 Tax=Coffea canephora TaxID=49390 RepID=A0A068VLL4_COFCA|nr:unnamed protein product [Coffea canephora]